MNQLGDVSTALFKRRHFDQEMILLCVRWYITYKLSYRDLREMMAERGIEVAHTTIMRWGPALCPGVGKALAVRPTIESGLIQKLVGKPTWVVDFPPHCSQASLLQSGKTVRLYPF
jgi:hypothetical protein